MSISAPLTSSVFSPEAALRRHGKSFHWARHALNRTHAGRATRLYGFCRYIDDIADQTPAPERAQQTLLAIQEQINACRSDDVNVRDMLALMRECDIAPVIVNELINGVLSDLTHTPFADQDVLLRYCYRVAGTVGLMMCKVLDVDQPSASYHAIDLGIGMQLTNICRDIAEDARQGRRYVPATLIGAISPARLIDPDPGLRPLAAQAVKKLLDLADHYYASGADGLIFLPPRARMSIRVADRVYHAIGERLAARCYAYWQGRVSVNMAGKLIITARTLADFLARPGYWRASREHDRSLHRALGGLPMSDTRGS